MTDIEHEVAVFMAKFSKSVNEIEEKYNNLSSEARQAIAKDAKKLLDDFSVANVLAHFFGQVQQ